jgi:ketosteroid isomerase-like protein
MNTKIVRKNLVLLTLIVLLCLAPRLAQAGEGDEKAVKQAVAQFYSALNTMFTGEIAPMMEVWSHAADVTYMGPGGGFEVGWKAISPIWEKQAAMKLGGSVNSEEMKVIVGDNLAVVHNYEIGKNTNVKGKAQSVDIRATNIFRKEDGKWKMIGHHTDLLPGL